MISRVLILLAVAAVAVNAGPVIDCSAGCPLVGDRGACGTNGITFINECLAVCSGSTVAHLGACAPYSSSPAAGATAAAGVPAPRGLDGHPIGQFLSAGGDAFVSTAVAGSVAASRVASEADMARFAAEGFALVGPAHLQDFEVKKPASSLSSTVFAAAKAASSKVEIFTVRVLPKEGLVYVSNPVKGNAADLSSSDSGAAKTPYRPATPVAAASASAAARAARRAEAGKAGARPDKKRGRLQADGWDEIATLQKYPYSAVGWLNVGFASGSGSCSGSMFGKHAVITAAHCVYSSYSSSSITSARFMAHHYFTPAGKLQKPYGSADAVAFDFLSGWTSDDMNEAWMSDMAVILLEDDVGSQTGMLGFSYNNSGYSGPITAAGYPAETAPVDGMFYKLKGQCVVDDTDGTDGQLSFKVASQNTCLSPCSIAERGQSGQPAFIQDGADFVVRGVLSHGPPAGECYGFDVYTEVDKMHYDFLEKYLNWTPADLESGNGTSSSTGNRRN